MGKRTQKAPTIWAIIFVINVASKLKSKPEYILILMNKIFICADSHCYIPCISQWNLPYIGWDVKYKYENNQSVHSRKLDWLLNTEIIRHHREGTVPILKDVFSQDVFSYISVSFTVILGHLGSDSINMIFMHFWSKKSISNHEIAAVKKTFHHLAQYLMNKRRLKNSCVWMIQVSFPPSACTVKNYIIKILK